MCGRRECDNHRAVHDERSNQGIGYDSSFVCDPDPDTGGADEYPDQNPDAGADEYTHPDSDTRAV